MIHYYRLTNAGKDEGLRISARINALLLVSDFYSCYEALPRMERNVWCILGLGGGAFFESADDVCSSFNGADEHELIAHCVKHMWLEEVSEVLVVLESLRGCTL